METKFDPHNNKKKFEGWKTKVSKGIPGINKTNSKLILKYLADMESGANVSRKSKKGARSFIRLNALRTRLIQLSKMLEARGINDLTQTESKDILSVYTDIINGNIKRIDGRVYTCPQDFAKDFKSFWHWVIKTSKGKIEDITQDLDTSKEENSFVYFTKEQMEKMLPYLKPDEQVRLLFIFDTLIRSPTELMNVKVSDCHNDFTELTIREETAKTFGRTIKLLLCKDALRDYVKSNNLRDNDFLFKFASSKFNKKIKKVAKQVLGNGMTKGGKPYSDMTAYDFRHSGACHWRLGAYRSKIDALMYRGGWSNLGTLNYYTKKLGMKDNIEKEDLLIGVDKTEFEKQIEELKQEVVDNRGLAYAIAKSMTIRGKSSPEEYLKLLNGLLPEGNRFKGNLNYKD